jgi:hypothetical protein
MLATKLGAASIAEDSVGIAVNDVVWPLCAGVVCAVSTCFSYAQFVQTIYLRDLPLASKHSPAAARVA